LNVIVAEARREADLPPRQSSYVVCWIIISSSCDCANLVIFLCSESFDIFEGCLYKF